MGANTVAFASKKYTRIGNLFYNLGFYAEYYLLRIWRVTKEAFVFLGQILVWLFGGFFVAVFNFFKSLLEDLTEPFTRIEENTRHLKDTTLHGFSIRKHKARTVKRKTKRFFAFLGRLGKFSLPGLAAIVLVYTVGSVFSMNYALQVEVNGAVIGYVADEMVLEDAQNILRMKINLAPNQSLDEWQFTPNLSIGTSQYLSSKTELADQILRTSPDVEEANGLYINDVLVGVTTDGQQLRDLLQSMKDVYYDPEYPDAAIDFVDKVEVSADGGLYFTESIQPFNELQALITGTVSPEEIVTASGSDSLSTIAHENNISMDQLTMRNPAFEGSSENYRPAEGTQILVQRAKPYLQIKRSLRYSAVENLPYEIEEVTVPTRVAGSRVVKTRGQDGEQQVWYDVSYVDGEEIERIRLDDLTEVITPAVNQVVEVGTMTAATGGVGGYSASYAWPVPDATYSSRGFIPGAHRGLDINAPTGTPIYAANGGTVVYAGWHWSYGYYVEIEHADGLRTLYAHCSALYINTGDVVGQGSLIAAVGSTGVSTGPHCHFEVQVNGVPVDPYGFVVAPW
ncbi:MAG: M23 family metallopeptidase [Oscillospiraceae bacterium]